MKKQKAGTIEEGNSTSSTRVKSEKHHEFEIVSEVQHDQKFQFQNTNLPCMQSHDLWIAKDADFDTPNVTKVVFLH
eukprot:11865424-Ditylum_brightwellii.AAC.1